MALETFPDDADLNLHVFAEPLFASTGSHLGHLLSALKPKPDLRVTPAGEQAPVPAPDDSGVKYGITADDLKTLHELWQHARGTENVRIGHPTNCMMAYLTKSEA